MARLTNPEPLSPETNRAFEELRSARALRGLTEEESGGGVDRLPGGVYGFTYSPAADNFPLFREREIRSYESHKLSDGSVLLLGFLTPRDRETFERGNSEARIHLFSEPSGEASELVSVPMSRITGHVENSHRGSGGLELAIGKA